MQPRVKPFFAKVDMGRETGAGFARKSDTGWCIHLEYPWPLLEAGLDRVVVVVKVATVIEMVSNWCHLAPVDNG